MASLECAICGQLVAKSSVLSQSHVGEILCINNREKALSLEKLIACGMTSCEIQRTDGFFYQADPCSPK